MRARVFCASFNNIFSCFLPASSSGGREKDQRLHVFLDKYAHLANYILGASGTLYYAGCFDTAAAGVIGGFGWSCVLFAELQSGRLLYPLR